MNTTDIQKGSNDSKHMGTHFQELEYIFVKIGKRFILIWMVNSLG